MHSVEPTLAPSETPAATPDGPVLPDYQGPCVSNVVPTLLARPARRPDWFPAAAFGAEQVVLLILDGLGWRQLTERSGLARTLLSLEGGPITTVAPSTTASALASISVGVPPGEHGVVGYRIATHAGVLNVLRWTTPDGDARTRVPPLDFQPIDPFLGQCPPVVTKAEFAQTGFTTAHLRNARWHPWRVPSTLVAEVTLLARAGEPFVYAYYDGLDKVAHEYGLGLHYDAELRFVDRLVAGLLDFLPQGVALLVTADHGQVHTGEAVRELAPPVLDLTASMSGEARFRWLHARSGRRDDLAAAAAEWHGDEAWVASVDQVLAQGWLGPVVSSEAAARLGDVAVVARGVTAFDDPADTGPLHLVGRHGGLTEAEMLVPLLVGVA
jgi:Type I phosphodiesterase / nucleotide pyrophosphatase